MLLLQIILFGIVETCNLFFHDRNVLCISRKWTYSLITSHFEILFILKILIFLLSLL